MIDRIRHTVYASSMNASVTSCHFGEVWMRGQPSMASLLIPERLMPERRGELELSLQPVVERPSFRLVFLLPDEIGANRDFIFGCSRTSVGHMHFLETYLVRCFQ